MKTSVAFLIYRRPDLTVRVFAEIARARPERLLVVADGPRSDEERMSCEAARRVIEKVNWPCEVLTHYSDVNLGCKRRVSSGLDWVFQNAEEAIILEDDCLPHPSFFAFAEAMLARYRDDHRIFHVGGSCFVKRRTGCSYYFSRYPQIWGWATWRRAWSHYDVAMAKWPAFREAGGLARTLDDPRAVAAWTALFNDMHADRINTWDHAWVFACMDNHGLTIIPSVNLVANIGFGIDATHTQFHPDLKRIANRRARAIGVIRHPSAIEVDKDADRSTFEFFFCWQPSWWISMARIVFSRWTYGRLIRRIPIVGDLWSRWRLGARGVHPHLPPPA